MIELLPESHGNAMGFKISDKVTSDALEPLLPQLDDIINKHGKLHVLVILHDFHGWGSRAMVEDMKFVMRHANQIPKCAIVGDSLWQRWFVALDKPFGRLIGMDERFFDISELDKAWEWVRDGAVTDTE